MYKQVTHEELVKYWKEKKLKVMVNRRLAGEVLQTHKANKNNKRAYNFWKWFAVLLILPLPIILWIFSSWIYAFMTFLVGLAFFSANNKSGEQFIVENVISDKDFWIFATTTAAVMTKDYEGNVLVPKELEKRN